MTPPRTQPHSSSRGSRARTGSLVALAAVGAGAIVGGSVGAAIDFSQFDQTQGGYEPPYSDYTGTTIDWSDGSVTAEGFLRSGIIVDTTLDCMSGMIGFTVFGLDLDFRPLSERAIVVHKPREACLGAGFEPLFG